VTNTRSLTVEGRHGFTVPERLQMFGEASYARDRFAGIDDQVTATAGVAYAVSVPGPQKIDFEGGDWRT
jgi:putative salt-induced outer membrane protein YdiY